MVVSPGYMRTEKIAFDVDHYEQLAPDGIRRRHSSRLSRDYQTLSEILPGKAIDILKSMRYLKPSY